MLLSSPGPFRDIMLEHSKASLEATSATSCSSTFLGNEAHRPRLPTLHPENSLKESIRSKYLLNWLWMGSALQLNRRGAGKEFSIVKLSSYSFRICGMTLYAKCRTFKQQMITLSKDIICINSSLYLSQIVHAPYCPLTFDALATCLPRCISRPGKQRLYSLSPCCKLLGVFDQPSCSAANCLVPVSYNLQMTPPYYHVS